LRKQKNKTVTLNELTLSAVFFIVVFEHIRPKIGLIKDIKQISI